jgi:hypothetical protein
MLAGELTVEEAEVCHGVAEASNRFAPIANEWLLARGILS